jgi:hypothetical protein
MDVTLGAYTAAVVDAVLLFEWRSEAGRQAVLMPLPPGSRLDEAPAQKAEELEAVERLARKADA